MKENQIENNKKPGTPHPPKRSKYKTPRLVEHGSFTKLTQGGGGVAADGGASTQA